MKRLMEGLPKQNTILFLFSLIVITTITYSNHFSNAFHFDDAHTIQNNIYIQNIKNISLFFKDGTTFSSLPSNQSYRPVVSVSLAIDYWFGKGYNLFNFHLSTFILFLLQGILMFFMIFKLLQLAYISDWNFYIAAAATSWYMLHPANAETVNYIIARSDIQSTVAVILAFVMYLFSPFSKKWLLYLIPVGIGTLAKPPAVMFAPLLFFYVLLFEQHISLIELFHFNANRKQIKKTIITVLPAFVFCVIMYFLVDYKTPETWQSGGLSKINYLITQPFVIVHYFICFFLPVNLSADTDWQPLQSIWNVQFFVGMLFLIAMGVITFRFSKHKQLRPIAFGILWFFLALIPSSSVIPFAEVLNDHRVFFPYVGLTISVCWAIGLLLLKVKNKFYSLSKKYSTVIGSVVFLLLGGYAYGTHERNKVWKSEETLWYDVTIKSPKNGRGLMNYGLAKMSLGDYPTAEKYFLKALELWPYYPFLYVNMGVLKEATGDLHRAELYYKNGIEYGKGYPDCWFFYGRFLNNRQRYQEAISSLEKCISLSSAHIGARSELMKAYFYTDNPDKLIQLANHTLQVAPMNSDALYYLQNYKNAKNDLVLLEEETKKIPTAEKYLQLSLLYYQSKKYEQSIQASLQAIKLKPNFPEAYNNICSAYNMLQQYDKAIIACKKALEINSNFELAKNNLVLALTNASTVSNSQPINTNATAEGYLNQSLNYYNQGLYEKCVEACMQAIKLKPDYADAYSNMCAAYNQLKKWDKAIEAGNKALQINPAHQLAKGNLNWAKTEKAKLH